MKWKSFAASDPGNLVRSVPLGAPTLFCYFAKSRGRERARAQDPTRFGATPKIIKRDGKDHYKFNVLSVSRNPSVNLISQYF